MVQKKIDIKNIVDEKKLKFFFDRLFKIPRSITGKGFLKVLRSLAK